MLVKPMREELTNIGVTELLNSEDVETALSAPEDTTFVVVNSVCGCAAGCARPAVAKALKHSKLPTKFVTVFAGQDKEATEKARTYFTGYPASSPCFALMRGKTILEMIPRQEIEGYSADEISQKITTAFDSHL
ncbi:UNVERIFIED_CONTAM: hypothetical protein GTU68_039891 [Idotea baltica]|nr:hypothetical protein [Idotea baltica]